VARIALAYFALLARAASEFLSRMYIMGNIFPHGQIMARHVREYVRIGHYKVIVVNFGLAIRTRTHFVLID
jgi:hypothetical protein